MVEDFQIVRRINLLTILIVIEPFALTLIRLFVQECQARIQPQYIPEVHQDFTNVVPLPPCKLLALLAGGRLAASTVSS